MAKRVTKGNLWGFIQSRPYSSVADIRRLFFMEVEGASPLSTSEGTCFIGLPEDAADLIAQLCREGRVALDLNPNVKARVVQGVYPARLPAHRQAQAANGSADGERKRKRRRRRRSDEGGSEREDTTPEVAASLAAE